MIKPASGSCNMRCSYCFYADEMSKRQSALCGKMSLETLEQVVKKSLQHASGVCTFAFQGGEPTLIGLDFFRALIEFERIHNVHRVQIRHALQTNGLLIDRTWAEFLAQNHFLVGLSLDGPKEVHDRLRIDARGAGTFQHVMRAAQLLKSCKAEFNILTTITADVANSVHRIYGFYRKNHYLYQQYTPCLDPLGEMRGQLQYSLTPKQYAEFLKALFDMWYDDIIHGRFIYIRYFENLIGMLLGEAPESCSMYGSCSVQYVIEADGSVYPCDFYALDAYCLGNLLTDSFEQIDQNRFKIGFIEASRAIAEECKTCRWYPLCRNGCRRDRENAEGMLQRNYFCTAYKDFFEYATPRLLQIARQIPIPLR